MRTFKLTEERADFLIALIATNKLHRGEWTAQWSAPLLADLKAWRSEPDDHEADDSPEAPTDLESEVDDIRRRIERNTDGHGGMVSTGAIVRAVAAEMAGIQRQAKTAEDRMDGLGRYALSMTVELEFQREELNELCENLASLRKRLPRKSTP